MEMGTCISAPGSKPESSAAKTAVPNHQSACGWQESAEEKNKSTEGQRSFLNPVGLVNQGATCFLNTLLQCLFMTPEFKEKIDGSSSALEWELHSIFEKMEKMEKKPVETRKLTHCLGLAGTQQQDVAEIFYLLLNKLGSENVKKVFEATVTKTIECEACHTRQRDEPGDRLLLLPLSFYSHDRQSRIESVNDGLRNFLYKKTLSGDDMAFCDICKSKKPATLVQEFTCLPPVLVFQLKRFEYNPLRGFTKIHHSIKIPWTLDVPLSSPNESKSYHLFARCEHHGNVSGGHYTALIKSTSIEQWYRCSDETVTPWTDPHESEEKEDLWSTETYLLMYRQRSTDSIDPSQLTHHTPKEERHYTDNELVDRGADYVAHCLSPEVLRWLSQWCHQPSAQSLLTWQYSQTSELACFEAHNQRNKSLLSGDTVCEILNGLYMHLAGAGDARTEALSSLSQLAERYPKKMAHMLLMYWAPLNSTLVGMWQILGAHARPQGARQVILLLLEKMEERPRHTMGTSTSKYHQPLVATRGLYELLHVLGFRVALVTQLRNGKMVFHQCLMEGDIVQDSSSTSSWENYSTGVTDLSENLSLEGPEWQDLKPEPSGSWGAGGDSPSRSVYVESIESMSDSERDEDSECQIVEASGTAGHSRLRKPVFNSSFCCSNCKAWTPGDFCPCRHIQMQVAAVRSKTCPRSKAGKEICKPHEEMRGSQSRV